MKAKLLCLLEVCAIFSLAVMLFHSAQSLPLAVKASQAAGGRPVPGYLALLLLALGVYLWQIRREGLSSPLLNLNYQLKIAAYGFFPVLVLSSLLSWIDWRRWPGAVLISLAEIGLLLWFALWVRGKTPQSVVKPAASLTLAPLALSFSGRTGNIIFSILYFYLLVAFSEELLFRGYAQSRLNTAFGRPWSFFGIPVGWGWPITALLFGLWHLGLGTAALTWTHALWTVFAGLIFGLVREKSAGITASTLLHGVLNFSPLAVIFEMFSA